MTDLGKQRLFAILVVVFFYLWIVPPVIAAPFGGDDVQLTTKAQRGAYVGFTIKWGGPGPVQKFLDIRSIMPRFGAPMSAVTASSIRLNAIGDLNPFGWTRRTQLLTALGMGAAIWAYSNVDHSGHHRPVLAISESEDECEYGCEDEEEDSDEDSDFDHCTDGHGQDGYTPACD